MRQPCVLLVLLSSFACISTGLVVPAQLSVEYLPDGAIVDVPAPRFSWQLLAAGGGGGGGGGGVQRARVQRAWELEVRDAMDGSLRWASGRQPGSAQLHIEYNGAALSSDAQYGWAVRVWGSDDGAPSPFVNGTFGTALLPGSTWASTWVTSAGGADHDRFRSEFWLPSGTAAALVSARAYFIGLGYGQLRLNGGRLQGPHGGEELGPWTTWTSRVLYRAYDLLLLPPAAAAAAGAGGAGGAGASGAGASGAGGAGGGAAALLRDGANVLGVELGNGQWRSKWAGSWWHGGAAALPLLLRCELRLTLRNGTTMVVAPAAAQWHSAPSPRTADDVYGGERFDARLETDGWDSPGFANASGWEPAALPTAAHGAIFANSTLSLHRFTPIRRIARPGCSGRAPASMWVVPAAAGGGAPPPTPTPTPPPANSSFVFDFGTNTAGWTTLRLSAAAAAAFAPGQKLTLAYGEQLRNGSGVCLAAPCVGGSVYYPYGGAVDTYTFSGAEGSGSGVEWAPKFTYHGFQFVQVSGWPADAAPPTLALLTAEEVHSDNEPIATSVSFGGGGDGDGSDGSDDSDGELLSALHEILQRSLLSNMHSVESDCPTRERVGWTGDAQATAESAFRLLGTAGFYSKYVRSLARSRLALSRLIITYALLFYSFPLTPLLVCNTLGGCRTCATRPARTARSPPPCRSPSICPPSIPHGRLPTRSW